MDWRRMLARNIKNVVDNCTYYAGKPYAMVFSIKPLSAIIMTILVYFACERSLQGLHFQNLWDDLYANQIAKSS